MEIFEAWAKQIPSCGTRNLQVKELQATDDFMSPSRQVLRRAMRVKVPDQGPEQSKLCL